MKRTEAHETMFNPANEDSTERHTFWLVPYGNMMTILMIFFLIMYAFSVQNKLKVKKVTESIEESMKSKEELKEDIERLGLVGEFRQFIWNSKLDRFIEVASDSKRIIISMQAPILFDSGNIELKQEGKKVLDQIARLIKSEVGEVRVAGYTDNTPIRSGKVRDNWELSGLRAYRVVDYFTREQQVIPIRISLNGHGEYAPLVPNDTPENRALNRRIEVSIIKKRKLWTE